MKEPTPLQMLIASINKTGTSKYSGLVHQIPLRVEYPLFSRIEMITRYTGISRNKIINDLLWVGIEEVLNNLDPEVVMKMQEHDRELEDQALQAAENGEI
jgi:hypothetical protein